MLAGNAYAVSNPTTVVIEGAGGVGLDVVRASVSYTLTPGSEIELLTTSNARAKTAINLTGNDLAQTLHGNAGANILEGKGGADVLTGGAGQDVFVLSNSAVTQPGPANIDRITDYANGEIVDITQILTVAAGTNVVSGGYVRVTTGGLVQVDLNGGGNQWVTLSSINGSGAVNVRYVAGGEQATASVNRSAAVSQAQSLEAVLSGWEDGGQANTPVMAHSAWEPLAFHAEPVALL